MNLFPYRDPCDLHNYYPLLYFIFMLVTLFPAREGRGNTRKSKLVLNFFFLKKKEKKTVVFKLVLVFLYSPVLRLITSKKKKKKKKIGSKQTLWVRVYMDWFEKFSSLNLKCRSQLNAIDMTFG